MNMLVRFGMAATTVMLTISVTMAGDLSIPNSFTADTPAVAAEVNSNFSAVETEVDDNNTRINTNAGNISTNVGNIGSNTAAIGVLQSQTQNLATGCPAGQSIRAIAANGNVTCEVDDDTNSGGDITGVTAGTGLSGGATSGDATLNVDTSYVQRRVTGRCSTGTYIAAIAANGTVGCVSDSDTTYTAGAGLDLNGTQFSVTPGGIEETMLANDSVTGAKLAPGYASFHASAFQFSGNNIPNWQSNTIFYPTDNGTRAYANANVSLPDGVIVTGIYCTE